MTRDRKEYMKKYRELHKEEIKQQKKEYRESHKEEIQKKKKEYRDNHKEELKQYNKEYNKSHKEERKKLFKEYRTNPDGYMIYCHINKLNGKRYIGKTKCKLDYRKQAGYKFNKEFNYLIETYGWDLFESKILLSDLNEDEATYFEKKFIKMFNTTDEEYGYNRQIG